MMTILLSLLLSVLPSALLAESAQPSSVSPDPVITEWQVPWDDTRPRDPYVDNQGRVWFVGQRGNYAAYLNPEDGTFQRFDLPERAGPHNLIVAEDGTVWYAGNTDAHIGRLDPSTGKVEKFPMPNAAARDPHTLVFDQEGRIWFTVQGGNFVGRFDPASGETDLVAVPTERARPYGIAIAADGRPWIAEFGTNKLATVDPETLELREVALPREDARARRLSITPDGLIWYVDYSGGFLGRYNPETGAFTEWPAPSAANSRPYAMTVDEKGRLWMVETGVQPNRFIGFDPETEQFTTPVEIESGGGTVRHMYYDAAGRAVWFGTDTNTIARAVLPE